MKYKNLSEFFNEEINLQLDFCYLDYYSKNKDKILDSEYAKDNKEEFEKINVIRNLIDIITTYISYRVYNIYYSLIYEYHDLEDGIITKKDFEISHRFNREPMYISSCFDNKPELLSLVKDEVNQFSKSIFNDEFLKILDDYDKKI